MKINSHPSPNFSPGRSKIVGQSERILAIVNHKTAGKYPGCRDWLCNPKSKASAHYLVTRAGRIDQLVADVNTAWHGGIVNKPSWRLYEQIRFNPNRWTIGIEHEDYDGDGELGLTEAQYQATLWLHKQLISEYNIPVDAEHIVGHYRIDAVRRPNCPGPNFPWNRLFNDLKGGASILKATFDLKEVNVFLNGNKLKNTVILAVDGKDTTYIPAVALRAAGDEVTWDPENKSVIIKTRR